MRKSLFTVIGAAMLIGTSSLALAQYAPSNPVSSAATGAAGGAVGTATGAAAGTVTGTANMLTGFPFFAGRVYGGTIPPGIGGCPAGQMNYKGYCYPNQPAAFTQ